MRAFSVKWYSNGYQPVISVFAVFESDDEDRFHPARMKLPTVTFDAKLPLLLVVLTVVQPATAIENGSLATLCPSSCSCLGNVVDCSKRSLAVIPSAIPHWVETLDLCSNAIKMVDDNTLDGLERITEINLSDNQLESFNLSVLTTAPRLASLKLGHNRLRSLTSGWQPEVRNVGHLHLNHNEISSLDQVALSHMTSLRVLDVSNNRLFHLDNSSFPSLSELQQLFIGYNQILSVEVGSFSTLTNLEWLKLNKNRLRSINKNVFNTLHRLKYLELDRNRIRVVHGLVFQGLDSLVQLRLKHNSITDLMDGAFWGLTKIQLLDLSYNNISIVSKRWLYGLDSLQQLSLARNRINKIELEAWRFCRHMTDLDLRNNHLTSVMDKVFDGLDSLKNLQLSGNQLLYIDNNGFHGLAALQFLELSKNQISWTVEDGSSSFDTLTSLTRLHLSHNHIRSIPKRLFNGLNLLRYLHLDGNEISSIQAGGFESMKELRELWLNSSSLLCDCQLSWLTRWLRDSVFQSTVSAFCGFPESLVGTSILDVKPEQLQCVRYAKPVVTREPVSQKALRYGNVTLTCDAASSSDSMLTISWKKDNEVLPDDVIENVLLPPGDGNGDRIVHRVSSRLHLWPVQDSHAGRYQCIATNALGSSYSTKALITVNVYPAFVKMPKDVTVRSGATARLDCAASGVPSPEIALQKDGGDDFPAARERRMHIFPSDEMFFIVDVKSEDQGVYTCTAKNDVGVITANATLQVLEAPSFARRMENKLTREGETTVLECMSTGSPRPRITWLKDGISLTPTIRHFFTADDQLLVIVHSEVSDAGDYTCLLTNTLGSDRQTSRLTVSPADVSNDNNIAMTSDNATMTTGIIVIAVVVCVVSTSLIWVIVIYKTRQNAMFQLAGATFDTSCHHGDGTMSDADGSAQRLLTGSSHGNNSLANLKFHETGVDITDDMMEPLRCSPCRLHITSAFHDDMDVLSRNYHRHSCCLVREESVRGDVLPGHWMDTNVATSGGRSVDGASPFDSHLQTFRVAQRRHSTTALHKALHCVLDESTSSSSPTSDLIAGDSSNFHDNNKVFDELSPGERVDDAAVAVTGCSEGRSTSMVDQTKSDLDSSLERRHCNADDISHLADDYVNIVSTENVR